MNFKLCYKVPTARDAYIAPQLLTENQPEYLWSEQENLFLRYAYEFMPKGILTQFIVVMHEYILEHKYVWKSGVVLEKDRTRAEVFENYSKREIQIRIAGNHKKSLMSIIMYELDKIHKTYRRLKYDKLIPCNCSSCKLSGDPHFYPFEELQDFLENRQIKIQCRKKPYQMVNVLTLLDDVIDIDKNQYKDSSRYVFENIENVFLGDNKMTNNRVTITESSIQGNVVVAKTIKNSFSQIADSDASGELRDVLKSLVESVNAMANKLKDEEAEEVADDLENLVKEATKRNPREGHIKISAESLVKAAENVGRIGEPVINLAGQIVTMLLATKGGSV
jgi:gas vesicle protein